MPSTLRCKTIYLLLSCRFLQKFLVYVDVVGDLAAVVVEPQEVSRQ